MSINRFKEVYNYFKPLFNIIHPTFDVNKPYNCWIAGGAVLDVLCGKHPSGDIDIYFQNKEDLDEASKNLKIPGHFNLKENNNAIKFLEKRNNKKTIDLVKKYYPSPKDCIESFDFTICMIAIDIHGGIVFGNRTFIDIMSKDIVLNNIDVCPDITLYRVLKYVTKGYSIQFGELDILISKLRETKRNDVLLEPYKNIIRIITNDQTNNSPTFPSV